MKYAFALLACVLSVSSWAYGEAKNLKVDLVRVDKDGRGIVTFVSDMVRTPASCGTNIKRLAFDTNTVGGQGILSLVLTAKVTGKTVFARGNGQCNIFAEVEDWAWGQIN